MYYPDFFLNICSVERLFQIQYLVEQYSNAPDIQSIVLFLLRYDLRAPVKSSADGGLSADIFPVEVRAAEIYYLYEVVPVHYVLQFDVTVNDVVGVQLF
jgi:hypothetical protein